MPLVSLAAARAAWLADALGLGMGRSNQAGLDGLSLLTAFLKNGGAFGIKSRHAPLKLFKLLFGNTPTLGKPFQFLSDVRPPAAKGGKQLLSGNTPQNIQEYAYVADTSKQVDPCVVLIAEVGNHRQQHQSRNRHQPVFGLEKRNKRVQGFPRAYRKRLSQNLGESGIRKRLHVSLQSLVGIFGFGTDGGLRSLKAGLSVSAGGGKNDPFFGFGFGLCFLAMQIGISASLGKFRFIPSEASGSLRQTTR